MLFYGSYLCLKSSSNFYNYAVLRNVHWAIFSVLPTSANVATPLTVFFHPLLVG